MYQERVMSRYMLEASAITDVGKIREHNEDNFFFYGQINETVNAHMELQKQKKLEEPQLFGVFDGMGGERYGEEASFLMADTCRQFPLHPGFLEKDADALCQIGNERVIQAMKERSARMGTTASMLLFDEEVTACNVGDSPIYLFRDGQLYPFYQEHTEKSLYESLNLGYLLEKKKKYRLTQNIGMSGEDMSLLPYVESKEIQDGDLFLICSDGLTDMVSEEQIVQCLESYDSLKIDGNQSVTCSFADCGQRLLRMALEAGGRDNITMVLIRVIMNAVLSSDKKEKMSSDKIDINEATAFQKAGTGKIQQAVSEEVCEIEPEHKISSNACQEEFWSGSMSKAGSMAGKSKTDLQQGTQTQAEKSADGCHKKLRGNFLKGHAGENFLKEKLEDTKDNLQEMVTENAMGNRLRSKLEENVENLKNVTREDKMVQYLKAKFDESAEYGRMIRNKKKDGE